MSAPKRWASSYAVQRRWRRGRLLVRYTRRRSDGLMGRHGGGWGWSLGVRVSTSGRDWLFGLLVAALHVSWLSPEGLERQLRVEEKEREEGAREEEGAET